MKNTENQRTCYVQSAQKSEAYFGYLEYGILLVDSVNYRSVTCLMKESTKLIIRRKITNGKFIVEEYQQDLF